MQPLISIVSGTFQRLAYLEGMVASVRDNIPDGIPYEIVLVDGGSTDGTIEWCKTQADIRLIEHGALLGAIYAFCDGAKAARGKYVLLANDDVDFLSNSILPALVYLEDTPTCGAVAFPDNRPSAHKTRGDYGCQYMPAIKDGRVIDVIYAQVGLFRKWLGDACNWWGYGEIDAKTYGGDNFLSSRILEHGYTVDCLADCCVIDHVPQDELRTHNESNGDSGYHKMFPSGAVIADHPIIENPDKKQLRILYLPIYEPGHDVQKTQKRGLREALQKRGIVYELDYLSRRDLPDAVCEACRTFKPNLVLTQIHDAQYAALWQCIRTTLPNTLIVNWNGDVWPHSLTSGDMLKALKWVDLQTTVNASALDSYTQAGIPAAYWQCAFEPVSDVLPDMPAHDIVFLGNAYSDKRIELVKFLKALPYNVGIYGRGWEDVGITPDGECLYNFDKTRAIYLNAKLTVGDNQYPEYKGFVSNRIFDAMAAGTCLMLHQPIAEFEELTGITDNEHHGSWVDYDELQVEIRFYLLNEGVRQVIAQSGAAFIHEHHSFDARVAELFTLIKDKAERRMSGGMHVVNRFVTEKIGVRGIVTQEQYEYTPGIVLEMDARDAQALVASGRGWEVVR